MAELYGKLVLDSSGTFSIEDFLTLILTRELYKWANDPNAFSLFKEAAVRWFFTNQGSLSYNAIFNWLGPMQSAGGTLDAEGNYRGVYQDYFEDGMSLDELTTYPQYTNKGREIAHAILNPRWDWRIPDRNRPYSWGDATLITDEAKFREYDRIREGVNTTGIKDLIYKSGNQYICTLNQCEYWASP
jgi:hypothetical protein